MLQLAESCALIAFRNISELSVTSALLSATFKFTNTPDLAPDSASSAPTSDAMGRVYWGKHNRAIFSMNTSLVFIG